VRERWPKVAEWRKAYPDVYNETASASGFALEAAREGEGLLTWPC